MTPRERARLERQLVVCLTHACEIAKAEIPGFDWLTHTLDFNRFPASLRITWVFLDEGDKARALANGLDARMVELTGFALEDAGVTVTRVADHLRFDSEEACRAQSGGDWQRRLAR